MKGKIIIEVVSGGLSVDTHLENVSIVDKMNIVHAVTRVLDFDEEDLQVLLLGKKLGVSDSTEIRIDKEALKHESGRE